MALTTEHIIPHGLGGRLELLKASCFDCAKETGKVEQECLKKIFGPMRYSMGLSNRKKAKNPKDVNVFIVHHDESIETIDVRLEDHPNSFILFFLHEPDILLGLPPRPEFIVGDAPWAFIPDKSANRATRHGGKTCRIGSFNCWLFSRMLAKIAHSFAVADQGLTTFDPYLPNLILGKYETPSYLVGGSLNLTKKAPDLHHLHLYSRPLNQINKSNTDDASSMRDREKQFLIVDVRLFANLGTPIYRVVVGERKRGADNVGTQ